MQRYPQLADTVPSLTSRIRTTMTHVIFSDSLPNWTISGDFQSPSIAGTWPAFWITGVDNWPPESDIMEFKGGSTVWQNTMTGPDWQNVTYQTQKTLVSNAANSRHNYKIVMNRISSTNLNITYFVDNKQTAVHSANFMNQRFWLIIDLQMEGSSGSSGPTTGATIMWAKNIYVAAQPI
ncbi:MULTISPECIES: family 16 glycosylhydrolase [Chitinophagaceae]